MESQKRKYRKQKTEGQITVKHFLNTRLKGKKQEDEKIAYPLYVRITVKSQNTDIKSRLSVLVAQDNFGWFEHENSTLLTQEVNAITEIIRSLKPFDQQAFSLQQAITIYGQSIKPLPLVIDELLKTEIRHCIVKNTYDDQADVDLDNKGQVEVLSQESDLIQLINWQQPAHTVISRLQSVISDPKLSTALLNLGTSYNRAFNFDGTYNTLNAIHQYIAPPALIDWHSGTLQADIKAYYTNGDPIINEINTLINNHL